MAGNKADLAKKIDKFSTENQSLQFQLQQTNGDLEKNVKRLNECKQDYERQSGLVNRLQEDLKESRKTVAGLQNTIDGLSEGNLDLDAEVNFL